MHQKYAVNAEWCLDYSQLIKEKKQANKQTKQEKNKKTGQILIHPVLQKVYMITCGFP